MSKQIIIDVLFNNGEIDADAQEVMRRDFESKLASLVAQTRETFESIAVELNAFLCENPGLKTIATPSLIRSLWERKAENGELKGKTNEEKAAMHDRLSEVLDAFVKAHPAQFHTGKKYGIALRYAVGDVQKDSEGNPVFDAAGNEVYRKRWTDAEWAEKTTPKTKDNGAVAA